MTAGQAESTHKPKQYTGDVIRKGEGKPGRFFVGLLNILARKDGCVMCITAKEMNRKMEEIKSLEMLMKETEGNIKALKAEVIEYLNENRADCLTTNSKGKEILQFIGNMCKATLSESSRETVDKAKVKELLDDKDYQKVSRVSNYPVLRVS